MGQRSAIETSPAGRVAAATAGPEIDLVYAWVDGTSEDFQRAVESYADRPADRNPERYRDIHATLRYSLRSVARFAPWFRNIYIFTTRPQKPDWLDLDHPRIHLVHHDEVIAERFLPTFSTRVIESYLHEIPGSAEHLLYLNDDYLFGRETAPEDFLTREGRIKVFGTLFGECLPFRVYCERGTIKSLPWIEHTPRLIYKPFYHEMLAWKAAEVEHTRGNRFRRGTDLKISRLYTTYLLLKRRRHTAVEPAHRLLRYHRFHSITNDYARQKKKLAALRALAPKFYCLNDDQDEVPNQQVLDLVRDFLEDYYPDPSPYEK